jgi:hypothetical protein
MREAIPPLPHYAEAQLYLYLYLTLLNNFRIANFNSVAPEFPVQIRASGHEVLYNSFIL